MIFRTIQPERSAYLGLSEEAHRKNQRNMHVNAQVTAVTTMMEVSGNCINGIIYLVMNGLNVKFASSALFMLLHFVVLSYAFLMNTRYNKNRIIEYGWLNVIKNIFGCNSRRAIEVENGNVKKGNSKEGESTPNCDGGKIKQSRPSIASNNQNLTLKSNIQSNAAKVNNVQDKMDGPKELSVTCIAAAREPSISESGFQSSSQMKHASSSANNIKLPSVFAISCNEISIVPSISEKNIPFSSSIDQPSIQNDDNTHPEDISDPCDIASNVPCITEKDNPIARQMDQPFSSNNNVNHHELLSVSCIATSNVLNDFGKDILSAFQKMNQPSSSNKCEALNVSGDTIKYNKEPSISQSRSRIFDMLLSSLDEEKTYIYNVMRLVELEEAHANQLNLDILTYENVDHTIVELPHFLGSPHRRRTMRGRMISYLIEYKNDDDKYKSHFEYFMEMEENFIENGC